MSLVNSSSIRYPYIIDFKPLLIWYVLHPFEWHWPWHTCVDVRKRIYLARPKYHECFRTPNIKKHPSLYILSVTKLLRKITFFKWIIIIKQINVDMLTQTHTRTHYIAHSVTSIHQCMVKAITWTWMLFFTCTLIIWECWLYSSTDICAHTYANIHVHVHTQQPKVRP